MKVTYTYTTRNMEKKLMGDAMKAIKLATTNQRRLKKGIVIDKKI